MDPTMQEAMQDAANQVAQHVTTTVWPVLSALFPLTVLFLGVRVFLKFVGFALDEEARRHTAPSPPAPTEPLPPPLTPEEEELVQWHLRLQLHDHLQATLHGSPTPTAAPAQVGLLRQALRRRSIRRTMRRLEQSIARDTPDTGSPPR